MTIDLPGLPDPIFSWLVETVSQITGSGEVYLVGGAVRDLYLRQPCHDLDFALANNVKPLARKAADVIHGDFFMLDEERGTARVIYYPSPAGRIFLDFALLRGSGIEEDLRARDFTLNAMALDLRRPTVLIDPLGGLQDLEAKCLRLASPDALKNDPVRVLRAIRQSLALDLKLEPAVLGAMQRAAPLLRRVSKERQRDELFKILEGTQVTAAVRMMEETGALGLILPELAPMKGVTQSAPHVYDVWEHTLALLTHLAALLDVLSSGNSPSVGVNSPLEEALTRLERFRPQLAGHLNTALNPNRSPRSLLFLAGLYHDVAKPGTRLVGEDGHTHFIGHEDTGAHVVARRAQDLALSQDEVQRLEAIVAGHMRIHLLAQSGSTPSRRAIYRYFRRTGPAGVDICLLSLADTLATYGPDLQAERWNNELEICRQLLTAWWEHPTEAVSPPRLLTGDDLLTSLNMAPGPQIGEMLAAIREAQACGEITDRQQALDYAVKYLKGKKNDSLTG
jgi:tRNA nucleotidyltransferase/poly(A) polymerase